VSERGKRVVVIVVALVLPGAFAVAAAQTTGAARTTFALAAAFAIVGVVVFVYFWDRNRPLPPPIDPDSRLGRVSHFLSQSPQEVPVRYCPHCKRQRWWVPAVSYLPPTAAENETLCTPMSCKWYDEPSVPTPPR
jgi:hypothetical protein